MRLTLVILEKIIEVAAAAATFLLARYLYALSTPQRDLATVTLWLDKHGFYRLHWYRGVEYLHQLRAYRILKT